MKEAMARHLQAAEATIAGGGSMVASAGVDTDAAIDAALARTADATALVKAAAAGAIVSAANTALAAEKGYGLSAKYTAAKVYTSKLKAKMGTGDGQFLVGHLKYDGKASRKGGKGGNGDGKKEIGHLMRPLVVRPARYCSPRHPAHIEPLLRELHGTL